MPGPAAPLGPADERDAPPDLVGRPVGGCGRVQPGGRGRCLAEAGATLDDVVRTRTYVVDPADIAAVTAVHGELFATARPAATLVIVAGLIDPTLRVEVEAEALLPARGDES